jgi:hypothetical protein
MSAIEAPYAACKRICGGGGEPSCIEIQIRLTIPAKMTLARRATRLFWRDRHLRHDLPKVSAQRADAPEKCGDERKMGREFTGARIVRDRVWIHADELGERANAQPRLPELLKEFRIKHGACVPHSFM